MSSYNHFGCSLCGGLFNGGNCPGCSSVGSGNEFVYDPNPYSYNETPNFFNQPQQHQYETYSCELCGDSPFYGFDSQTRTPLVYEQEPCYNQNISDDYNPQNSSSFSQQDLCCENCGGPHELAEYINTPGWNRPAFCNNGDDDDEYCTIAVTPDFSITDSLIIENEHFDTISETESDEFIKSSVENLVLILRDNLFLERLLHDDPIPLRTLLTSHMTSEFFFPSSPIRLLHLVGSQPMLKFSYKAEASVIISIPSLVRGMADVVVEIKGTVGNNQNHPSLSPGTKKREIP
nr:hypothetical protein [Tanacetum cinerariifolium]